MSNVTRPVGSYEIVSSEAEELRCYVCGTPGNLLATKVRFSDSRNVGDFVRWPRGWWTAIRAKDEEGRCSVVGFCPSCALDLGLRSVRPANLDS